MIAFRAPAADDAQAIVDNLAAGLETYREWATGWEPPATDDALDRVAAGLAHDEVWGLLALDDGEPAGHVLITWSQSLAVLPPPPDHMLLWQLFVRTPWHGTGLAAELHRRAVDETRARGFDRMGLWTPRGHARARRFYEREGWRATGAEREESPLGLPVVEYVLDL